MQKKQNQPPTFESVWAALQETDRLLKEQALENAMERKKSRVKFEREMKKSRAEFDRKMEESRANFDREMKESRINFDREMKEFKEGMKELQKYTGSMGNNHGLFAEEYFFNSFDQSKLNFFGEQFDSITKNLNRKQNGIKAEYDIVLYNHTSVALIEVKYKALEEDIPLVIKKAETFRILFPYYKDFKIYLGLASMSFSRKFEDKCVKEGIAVIKQVGDTMVINDAHLKVY